MTLVFRADASHELGMGHLIRCLHLAECAASHNPRNVFVLNFANNEIAGLVRKQGYEAILLQEREPDHEFKVLSQFSQDENAAFIFDVCHQKTLTDPMGFQSLTRRLASGKQTSVLIDGLGQHSLSSKTQPAVDFVLIPYGENSTDEIVTESGRCTYLRGLRYFICHPDFQKNRLRPSAPDAARKILVSCGGSDPKKIAYFIMEEVEESCEGLEIRIVIGPAFEPTYIEDLKRLANQFIKNSCSFIISPTTLATQIGWADLAVGTSGLSKYEFAISGLPAILISIDPAHAEISDEFIRYGTAVHAGLYEDLPTRRLGEMVHSLASDQTMRNSMSEKGMSLSHGDGGFIIIDKIWERQIWKQNN